MNTILQRYEIVSRYMNNQTEEGWQQLLKDIRAVKQPNKEGQKNRAVGNTCSKKVE